MFNALLVATVLATPALSALLPLQQHEQLPLNPSRSKPLSDPLLHASQPDLVDAITELKRASIIPDILDPFTPTLSINITWTDSNTSTLLGNTVRVKDVQAEPRIEFTSPILDVVGAGKERVLEGLRSGGKTQQLTLVLTDPDAPSREDPKWSQMCHWIVTGVSLQPVISIQDQDVDASSLQDDSVTSRTALTTLTVVSEVDDVVGPDSKKHLQDIIPWKPPGPPPKTGKHRYVFVALAPKNGTTRKLQLSMPKDRQHWGYGDDVARRGVMDWAEENGLVVVGANFVYAQNDEQ